MIKALSIEQVLLDVKVEILKMRKTFWNLRRLATAHDYVGPENVVRVLFVSNTFVEQLRSAVRKLSFSTEESEAVNSILQARVFDDATVIFPDDLSSDAKIWGYFRNFFCCEFICPNGKLDPSSVDYIIYPGVKFYASVGATGNYYYGTTYDPCDEMVQHLVKHPSSFYIEHDCDEWACKAGGFSLGEFISKTDRRNRVRIKIEPGIIRVCSKCRERFIFCDTPPETIFMLCRKRSISGAS